MKVFLWIVVVLVVIVVGAAIWLYTPDKSRADLDAKYAEAPSEFLDVAGMRLHVRDTGPRDAPAVILLHGFGSSLHTWEPWAKDLAAKYRVIRYDLPGFGLTGPDPTGDYSDERGMVVLGRADGQIGRGARVADRQFDGGKAGLDVRGGTPGPRRQTCVVSPDGFAAPASNTARNRMCRRS